MDIMIFLQFLVHGVLSTMSSLQITYVLLSAVVIYQFSSASDSGNIGWHSFIVTFLQQQCLILISPLKGGYVFGLGLSVCIPDNSNNFAKYSPIFKFFY